MKVTEKEKKVLLTLMRSFRFYKSPTELSEEIWGNNKCSGAASRVCRKLEEFNLVERSDKGHYRTKHFITRHKIRYVEIGIKGELVIPKNTSVNLVFDDQNEATFRINNMDWAPEPRFGNNGILINPDHIKCINQVW